MRVQWRTLKDPARDDSPQAAVTQCVLLSLLRAHCSQPLSRTIYISSYIFIGVPRKKKRKNKTKQKEKTSKQTEPEAVWKAILVTHARRFSRQSSLSRDVVWDAVSGEGLSVSLCRSVTPGGGEKLLCDTNTHDLMVAEWYVFRASLTDSPLSKS